MGNAGDICSPINISINGGLNFVGEYNEGTTYNTGDVVSFNGSSYVAKQQTIGNEPPNSTYWQLLASAVAKIPEYLEDPIAPGVNDAWVKRNETIIPTDLSHTLLQIGLTAPGDTVLKDYIFKYKTESGEVVGVALA